MCVSVTCAGAVVHGRCIRHLGLSDPRQTVQSGTHAHDHLITIRYTFSTITNVKSIGAAFVAPRLDALVCVARHQFECIGP